MPVTLHLVDKPVWDAEPQVRHDLQRIYAEAPAERLGRPTAPFLTEHLEAGHFFGCAHFNDRLLGAVAVEVETKAKAWWLAHLYVRKATRRRGVGSRLLALIGDAARADDHELRVLSGPLSISDQQLLARLGYRLHASGSYFQLTPPLQGGGKS